MKLVLILLLCLTVARSIRIPLKGYTVPENKKILQSISKSWKEGNRSSELRDPEIAIDLNNFQKVQYYGILSVGTPGQDFQVLFDTGSDIFWIPGIDVTGTCGGEFHKFNSQESTSFKDLDETFRIDYLKGFNELALAKETVTLGGASVTDQILGLVTSGDCKGHRFDGIMGMSQRMRSKFPPVFETMIQQKVVNSTQFSFYFSKDEGEHGGELYLGGYDKRIINEDQIKFVPTIKNYPFWIVEAKIMIGSTTVSSSVNAILDTGTSLILGESSGVSAIARAIGGYVSLGMVFLECKDKSVLDSLPVLTFIIGGIEYSLNGHDLLIEMIEDYCVMAIGVGQADVPNSWLFGDAFLRKVYSIHDYGKGEVALVPLRGGKPYGEGTTPTPSGGGKPSGASTVSSSMHFLATLGLLYIFQKLI